MGSSHLPPQFSRRESRSTGGEKEQLDPRQDAGKLDSNSKYVAWAIALWPLVLHCIVAICIAVLVMYYVRNNHFNLKDRRPLVLLADGTTTPWTHYAPLQSDITTLISSSLVILRLITGVWLGSFGWRCAFILMGKPGLKAGELYRIISYGIHIPSMKDGLAISLLISLVLVIVRPVYLVAPVLTGSITWTPSNQPMGRPSNFVMGVSGITSEGEWWGWRDYSPRRERTCMRAAGLANIAWGRDSEAGVLKRTLPSAARLEVNSTISNVTLPYFSVTKLEWIQDPQRTLTAEQLSIGNTCGKINLYSTGECILFRQEGTVALIPDTPWTNTSFPSPSIISETRLMILYTNYGVCKPIFDSFPANIGLYYEGGNCWAFAWVTYTAGVGVCTHCRVSSYATVQNDGGLEIIEDRMASEALLMMPTVITMMALMNTSMPSQGSIDEYVVTLLSRSYAASWTALTDYVGSSTPALNTTYSVTLPSSRAVVNQTRVYIWLSVQLLIAIFGILLLFVQDRKVRPMIGEMSLVPFYLDSSDVYENNNYDRLKEGAHLELKDGRLEVGNDGSKA